MDDSNPEYFDDEKSVPHTENFQLQIANFVYL